MNARILSCVLCFGGLAGPAAAVYGPPVLETGNEFLVYGDFSGSGRRDFAIVDRASGGMRMANTSVSGDLVMGTPTATGITGVTAVAVGRLILATHDALAVTSPDANRGRVVGQVGTPFDVWLSGVGPRHLTALPLPGGSAGLDDLVGVTTMNPPMLPFGIFWREWLLNNTSSFSPLATHYPEAEPQWPLAVALADGESPMYADMQLDKGALVFTIYDARKTNPPPLTQVSGIPAGSRVVYGTFNPTHTRSVFVFHVPGSQVVRVSTLDASGALGPLVPFDLAARAELLQPVKAGSQVWLAAVSAGGEDLRLYSFGKDSDPKLAQTINAPRDYPWRGLLPALNGGFLAAYASPGSATSDLAAFTYTGGTPPFAAGRQYRLPALLTEELGSDVLLFSGKPFSDNNPILRGRYRAGGWSSQLNDEPQFGTSMYAQVETWRGAALGLGGASSAYLGTRPAGVTHGMSNQLAPDTSFYSLDAPIGGLADTLAFDPPAGPQTVGIEVSIESDDPNTLIRYVVGNGTRWNTYSGPLGPFFADTTVRAYGVNGGTKTPIQTASYTFPSYPGDIDSDGDGVPDFVEAHHGLDPLASGFDGDGDGCPDMQEILAGTDPTDPAETPVPAAIQPFTRYFRFATEPLSHPGVAHNEHLTLLPSYEPDRVRDGTWVTVNRPDGTLEFEGDARRQPDSKVKLVDLQRTVPTPPLFWVAGTPNRFMIDIQSVPDPLRGRGVFRLLDYTAPPLEPLPRPALSGSTADQVSQWVTAVRDHFTNNAKVELGGPVSLFETVHLLLAEHALGHIFHNRRRIPTAKLSLTPFRGDAMSDRWAPPGVVQPDRHRLREQWLAELPSAAYGDDGYDWTELLLFIRKGLLSHGITRAGLDDLARECYRIGFHAFDDETNPLNLAPFDALREYLDTGTLPVEYAKKLTTPASVLTNADAYRSAFLNELPLREHTAGPLLLVAGNNFYQDPWLVLDDPPAAISYWLADPAGMPLPSPNGFRILPGCRFLVGGHLANRQGGGRLLLVDSITLYDAPMPPALDGDGNLLVDNWEAFHFGVLGNDPFGDTDRDNFMTLQEMFENSDPVYGNDFPAVQALNLRAPVLHFVPVGNGQFDLSWQWPSRYHDRVRFFVEGGDDLKNYQLLRDNVAATSGDWFQTGATAAVAAARYFFRVGFDLR